MDCKICGEKLVLGHSWKRHRIKESEYFHTHEPRFSKQTGKLIRFKNREFYLENDFNDKKEMSLWLKSHPEYGMELLKRRQKKKNLTYSLSQVELRSLGFPSIQWYEKNLGNYEEISGTIGLKSKFTPIDKIFLRSLAPSAVIVVDTREQKPFRFSYSVERKKLDFADYTVAPPNHNKVYIERKTLNDFVSTCSGGRERFSREIERAIQHNAKFVVLVESSFEEALRFKYLWRTRYSSKTSADFIFHFVRDIMQKHPNVQFLFGGNLAQTNSIAERILSLAEGHWPDLQFALETGAI